MIRPLGVDPSGMSCSFIYRCGLGFKPGRHNSASPRSDGFLHEDLRRRLELAMIGDRG